FGRGRSRSIHGLERSLPVSCIDRLTTLRASAAIRFPPFRNPHSEFPGSTVALANAPWRRRVSLLLFRLFRSQFFYFRISNFYFLPPLTSKRRRNESQSRQIGTNLPPLKT